MRHSTLIPLFPSAKKRPLEMEQLRERLTSFTIAVALTAGFPIILYKVAQTLSNGYELSAWPSMVVYSCLALFAILRRRIDYRLRASLSISLMFLTVFFGLSRLGYAEAALIASLSSSVFSLVILGRKVGMLFALFFSGAGLTFAFVFGGLVPGGVDSGQAIELIFRWWPQLIAIFSFYFCLAVSIGMIEGTLIQTLLQTECRKQELELLNGELQTLKEAAEKANYTKSQFMSVMSHELKTPLNPILGLINLIKEEPINRETLEYLELMESSTHHLLSLINEILDYIHTDRENLAPNLQPIHIKEFCENLTRMHRVEAEQKGLDLQVNFRGGDIHEATGDLEIINDPNRLTKILSNLISNSIKFTNRGHIVLGVDHHTNPNNHSEIEFTVSDTGIGISKSVQDQIFEPFVQGFHADTRKYSGIGLGLSVVNKLCVLLNGSLQVHSVEGEGTEFKISLPCDISVVADNHPITYTGGF